MQKRIIMNKLLLILSLLSALPLHATDMLRLSSLNISPTDDSIFADVSITIEGGTPPYTYGYFNSSTSENIGPTADTTVTFTNIRNGVFVVGDSAGAFIDWEIVGTIGTTNGVSITLVPPCNNQSNGSITMVASPASFSLKTSDGLVSNQTGIFNDLPEGEFGLFGVISEPNNTTTRLGLLGSLIAFPPVSITTTPTNTTCGEPNGSILINTICGGGSEPYAVELSPGNQTITFPTKDTFTMLPSGMYTVTATSANNCSMSSMVEVGPSQPVIIENLMVTNPTCSGDDGTVKVTANSPAPPLTFTLNGQQQINESMAEFTVAPGMYTLTVTDMNNCSTSQMVTVVDPLPLEVTAITSGECGNNEDGSIEVVNVNNGTPPYIGCINTTPERCMAVPGTFSNLPSGTYQLTVTDANKCSKQRSVTIEQLTDAVITAVEKTDPTCNGFTNGEINVVATPDNEPIRYVLELNGNQIDLKETNNGMAQFTGLGAGDYTITATVLSSGCMAEALTSLMEPAPLLFMVEEKDTTCAMNNGMITITQTTGGTTPYEYSIGEAFQSSPLFMNLAPGSYTVTVKDTQGCTSDQMTDIAPSGTVVISNVIPTIPSCPGFSDGSIKVFAESPESPTLTYTLSGQENQQIISSTGTALFEDLPAGFYMVQVVDETTSCSARTRVELESISPIRFRPPTVTPETCKGANNGTILLKADQVTGGTPPYTYSIGTKVGFIPVGDPFMNLSPGGYSLTVKDANGCLSQSFRVFIQPAAPITICKICTTPADCPEENGTIWVIAKSTMPLQYALNDGPFQKDPVFTDLAPGTYRVIVNREGDNTGECATCCTKVKRAKKKCR